MKIFLKENKTALLAILLFIIYSIYDFFQYSVNPVGVDAGYFLSISRDWVTLNRIPGVDTRSGYTTLGYIFYVIPYLLFQNPNIIHFLLLNLALFGISYYIYFKIVTGLLKNESLIFLVLFTFVYNFHSITTDIKLENLILFFNTISAYGLYYLSTIHTQTKLNRKVVVVSILLALSAATAFLVKQYAGLSIIFIIAFIIHLKVLDWQKITVITFCSFTLFVVLYLLTQLILGLNSRSAYAQITGTLEFNCVGSVYGERQFSNLICGLKYYKFDLVFICGVIYGIYSCFKPKTTSYQKISRFIILILLIILSQTPFYFQTYPHYKMFGAPFILFFSIIAISKIKTSNISNLSVIINSMIFLQIILSAYSMFSWFKGYTQKYNQKLEQQKFESQINEKLPIGTRVFMLNQRSLWFTKNFTTPFPKTLSYGFVALDCIEKAISIEKPLSFWLAGSENMDFKIHNDNYVKTDSFQLKYKNKDFKTIEYRRKL